MNAAFLTFTCSRDAALVPLWAQAIRRLCPAAPLVAAVDLADADMPLPRKVTRFVTEFDRRGNLNGIPAIAGILGAMLDVALHTGLPVVKIDSDTVLSGAAWLRDLERFDYVGFEGGIPLHASGMCYALTQHGLEAILRGISPWPWQTQGQLPEDQTICTLALMHARAKIHPWAGGEHVLAFMPPHFGRPTVLRKAQTAIHCGQAGALAKYPGLDRTHLVARMMRTTLRCLSGRPRRFPAPQPAL